MRLSQWQPVREVICDQPLPRTLRLRQRSPRRARNPRAHSQPPLARSLQILPSRRIARGDHRPGLQWLDWHPQCHGPLRGCPLLRLLHILITHSKPMKKPYNPRFRIVLDIAMQVMFYASLIGAFWLITFLMP